MRHGETEWSRDGRHTGRTDIPLTEVGRRQALDVRSKLEGHQFALVLSSPLSRALDTARLAGFGDVVQVDPDLAEWDYGAWEGLTTPQIRKSIRGWTIWANGARDGETATQVAARCDRVIARVRAARGDVLLFGHGHLLATLHDPADRSQHARLSGDRLQEIDVELRRREGLAGRERTEHRKPHRTIGERCDRSAVHYMVRVVELACRRHLEGCAAVGHGDEAHVEQPHVGRGRRRTTEGSFEEVTTGRLGRRGHRPHCRPAKPGDTETKSNYLGRPIGYAPGVTAG